MSFQASIFFEHAFYHVCSRGFNKQEIFLDRNDYARFLETLVKAIVRYQIIVHSYCLIPNHYHIYLQTMNANLSLAMKFINESYAKYFINKYAENHDGYVFGRRYRRHIVQSEKYTNNMFAYVNANAVKHRIVSHPREYPWSSYHELAGNVEKSIVDKTLFLKTFGSIKNLDEYISMKFDSSWSPEAKAYGNLVLGDEEFVSNILDEHLLDVNDNIINAAKLKKPISSNKIMNFVDKTSVDGKLKEDFCLYLHREYTAVTRAQLGEIYALNPSAISKRVERFKLKLRNNSNLNKLVNNFHEQLT